MSVRVEPVEGRAQLRRFVTLPWSLYGDDPCWVPPLVREAMKGFDPRRNPFFAHGEIALFLALRDGRAVGRIAAIRNRAHESFHAERVGFFGFFECADDDAASGALLHEASLFARARGLERLRGPVNPTTNDELGTLVDGFDTPPMILTPHGRRYYDRLLRGCGLEKARDLMAYVMDDAGMPERLERGGAIAERRNPGVSLRSIDMRRFDAELDRVRDLYNRAWEKNWGFVPMTDAEVSHMARQLKPVIDPSLVVFAEREGLPVGFALGMPDVHQALRRLNGRLMPLGWLKLLWHLRRVSQMRVMALGLVPEARGSGVDVMLYRQLYRNAVERGYRRGEFSWILEDNTTMRKPLETIGARVYKTWRIYEAPVDRL
ncbi:MAG: N-acetyltransferase [Candidatus Krumholzibacteria bacterium]|nr:N-acetyltransferase [Candidatus Krumholzibacteria bacterium]